MQMSDVKTLRAGCRNARLTARLANRGLTVTVRLTCGCIARSTVNPWLVVTQSVIG